MRVTSIAIALSLCCTALPFAVRAAGNLNVVCSADVVVCEQMTRIFSQANPDINVSMVRLSAGEAYARLRSESRNPRTDIWWAGTGDPHMQAAEEGLTQEYQSPLLAQQHDWAQKQAENSNYRTVGNQTDNAAAVTYQPSRQMVNVIAKFLSGFHHPSTGRFRYAGTRRIGTGHRRS